MTYRIPGKALALCLILAIHGASAAEPTLTYQFDISNQTLSLALRAYGQISGQEIVFTEDLVSQAQPATLKGRFTADAALDRLLDGTGLMAKRSPSGALMICSKTAAHPAQVDAVIKQDSVESTPKSGFLRLAWLRNSASQVDATTSSSDSSQTTNSTHSDRAQSESADNKADPVRLDEIIVTAQKRAQALKDVPISITAIGSEQLETLRVRNISDYIMEIPNASYISFGPFGSSISMRGINAFSGGRFEPTAVLIDDSGFGATNVSSILSAQFLDIERVEVLRGPQGVLTGRNALGGAINLITAKPSTKALEFNGTLDIGRFDSRFIKGVANIPLGDKFAIRAVGYKEDSDGAVRNIGTSGGSSSTDNAGGRIAARFQPTDALTFDASFAYEEQEYGIPSMMRTDRFRSPEDREFTIAELASWGGDFNETDFFERTGNNGGTVQKDVPERSTFQNQIASVGMRYDLGSHSVELKYSNYKYEHTNLFDWDQTNYAWLRSEWGAETDSDSAELKVASAYDGKFNWVAGIGYLKDVSRFPFIDEFGDWYYGANDGIPILNGSYNTTYIGDGQSELESIGYFANGFWDIGDQWHLSAGGRLSVEKSQSGDYFLDDAPDDPRFIRGDDVLDVPGVIASDMQPEAKITQFTPRIALNYDITDQVTSYVQYSTGYRAGYSNNPRAIEAGFPTEVDPETVENYEVGLKGQLFESRVAFALSLFHMNYEDLQLTLVDGDPGSDPTNPITVEYDTNAGKSTSRGVELEAAWRPLDALEFTGSVAYTEAEIKSITVPLGVDEETGEEINEELRNVPVLGIRPWTAALAGTYRRPINTNLDGHVRLSWHYQDSIYTEGFTREDVYFVPEFQTVDLSIGIAAGDRWVLTAYAENLLDEKYFFSTQFEAETSRRGGMVTFLPRIWGLRFTMNFRQ